MSPRSVIGRTIRGKGGIKSRRGYNAVNKNRKKLIKAMIGTLGKDLKSKNF